jgi:hypothetical protein
MTDDPGALAPGATHPCPQVGTQCATEAMGRAETVCGADGTWDVSPGACTCFLGPKGCGNGRLDSTEQCDGMLLNGQTCATMGMGAGVLRCDIRTCTFDTSMCGQAAAMGAGGAGGM